jgi:hypothetical protein
MLAHHHAPRRPSIPDVSASRVDPDSVGETHPAGNTRTVDATASSVLHPPPGETHPSYSCFCPGHSSRCSIPARPWRAHGAACGDGARSGGVGRGQGVARPTAPLTLPEIPPGASPVCFKWIRQLGSCTNTDVCARHTNRSRNFANWPPAVAQQYTAAILAMPPP